MNTQYSGYEIGEAEYVETADYGIIYEVVIEKGDKKIEIYFYPDGMILKEEIMIKETSEFSIRTMRTDLRIKNVEKFKSN